MTSMMMRAALAASALAASTAGAAATYVLQATPATVAWGHYDAASPPVLIGTRKRTRPFEPLAPASSRAARSAAERSATRTVICSLVRFASSERGWKRLIVTRGVSSPERLSSSTLSKPHWPAFAAASSAVVASSSNAVATNCPLLSLNVAIM